MKPYRAFAGLAVFLSLLVLVIVMIVIRLSWPTGYAWRIPFQVNAKPCASPLLVVIPASQVLAAVPGKTIPSSAVCAMGLDGAVWPIQVNERDGTGRYQRFPNRILDPDDEIAFLMKTDGKGRGFLYVDTVGKPSAACQSPFIFNAPGRTEDVGRTVNIACPFLHAELRGPETGEPGQKGPPGLGKGSLVALNDMTASGAWDHNCIWHHPYLFWNQPQQWTTPRVISSGPVQVIVETHIDAPLEGIERVIHTFVFPTAPLNPIRIDECIMAKTAAAISNNLTQVFYMAPGGKGDKDDRLVFRSTNGVNSVAIKQVLSEGKRGGMPMPSRPEGQWFAWQDGGGGNGLAVLAPDDATMTVAAYYCTGPYPYSAGENRINSKPQCISNEREGHVRFALLPFKGQAPIERIEEARAMLAQQVVKLEPCESRTVRRRATGWQTGDCPYRVRLEIEAPSVALSSHPVILEGAVFYKAGGAMPVRADSLKLFCDGQAVDVQVDHRDRQAFWSLQPNNIVDDNDEISFTVSLAVGQKRRLELYYQRADSADAVPRSVEAAAATNLILRATNDLWSVGLFGGANAGLKGLDLSRNGTLGELTWKGQPLLRGGSFPVFSAIMLRGGSWPCPVSLDFSGTNQNFDYTPPRCISQGSVRAILCTRGIDPQSKSAVVEHAVSVFREGPVLTFTESFIWPDMPPQFAPTFAFPIALGGGENADDFLAVPLTGKPLTFSTKPFFGPDRKVMLWDRMYSTLLPEAGWLAWLDQKSDHGLTVCFDPLTAHVNVTFHKMNTVAYSIRYGTGRERFSFYTVGLDANELTRVPERYRYLIEPDRVVVIHGEEAMP